MQPASLQQNVCGSVLAALGNGLLDRDGSISITNDGEINGDLVLTVRHHVMQPLVMTLNLWNSAICNLCTAWYIDQNTACVVIQSRMAIARVTTLSGQTMLLLL